MIRKIILSALLVVLTCSASFANERLAKYGQTLTVDFAVYEVDGVDLRTDWVPAAADCEIMKDEGASTQCTKTATDEGSTYSIVLTNIEMQAARLVLKIVDAATKAFLDSVVIIETYGNVSALHAFDLDTASVAQSADNETRLATIETDTNSLNDTKIPNTLNTTATGNIGIDWANVENKTSVVDLTQTDIQLVDTATTNTDMRGTDSALLAANVNVAAGIIESNLQQIIDVTQSATDLKDFADDGYNPGTNKVVGVVLVDTTTTNTDMVTEPPTAAAITNDWETQSQADPTGFHINVQEWIGTAVTLGNSAPDVNIASTDDIDLSATQKASVNTEVDNALDTAIPASPVAGSVNNALNNQNEIILAGAASGTHSTTTMQTDLTVTVNDQYNGRIITFTSDTATVALRNQQTDITDTVTTSSELTFTALTVAPSDGDKFVIN